MSVNDSENFDDVERDDAYFDLFFELEIENAAQYEELTKRLIKEKSLVIQIENFWVKYSLDRYGCSAEISQDAGQSFSEHSWSRLGWSKKNKEKHLPTFLAQTETDLKFGLEN
jgi:hypothetical protein